MAYRKMRMPRINMRAVKNAAAAGARRAINGPRGKKGIFGLSYPVAALLAGAVAFFAVPKFKQMIMGIFTKKA